MTGLETDIGWPLKPYFPLLHIYGTKSPMTRHCRTLCQSFVLTPAMKVVVDPSVEQPLIVFAYIIKSANAHV